MANLKNNKKAVELTLQTIIVFIIIVIVITIMIYFFSTHFNDNNQTIISIGEGAINSIE